MRTFKTVVKTIVVLTVLVIVVGGVYLYSGAYPVGADAPHNAFTYWLLDTGRDRSVEAHARDIKVPNLNDPQAILVGAGQYAAMCSSCHLAPGYDKDETWEGLYPQPPKLYQGSDLTPAQVFWILKHGLKMSGMPAWGKTHDDKELWAIVAFVEQLPKLNAQQYKDIVARAPMDPDMTRMPMPGGAAPIAPASAPMPTD